MAWHHVAQRAGGLVEFGPVLDAHGFRDGDLHMVDPVAVPDRLEHPVGEAERQDGLDRVLAEEMVDPEGLILGQGAGQEAVQIMGGGDIVTERFFDHHPPPAGGHAIRVLVFVGQPGLAEFLHDGREIPVGGREVEQRVAPRAALLSGFLQKRAQLLVGLAFGEIASHVAHAR